MIQLPYHTIACYLNKFFQIIITRATTNHIAPIKVIKIPERIAPLKNRLYKPVRQTAPAKIKCNREVLLEVDGTWA